MEENIKFIIRHKGLIPFRFFFLTETTVQPLTTYPLDRPYRKTHTNIYGVALFGKLSTVFRTSHRSLKPDRPKTQTSGGSSDPQRCI